MLNYFTIPEIDIAFTIATTKLWSIQKFKVAGSIWCVWVYLSVYMWVYACVGECVDFVALVILQKDFDQIESYLVAKEGETISPVFRSE